MNNIRYQKLLSPFRINRKYTLKSRMISGHVPPYFTAGPQSWPDENVRAHFRNVANNGCAMILYGLGTFQTMEEQFLEILKKEDPTIEKLPDFVDLAHHAMMNYDDTDPCVQNVLCKLANEIHSYGTRLILNVEPQIPRGYTYGGGPYCSQQDLGMIVESLPALPKEDIPQVIAKCVDECVRYHSWGWDGVQLNPADFLNRSFDARTDEYGGSVAGRGRLMIELITGIRKALGPDFIIEIDMPAETRHGTENRAQEGYPLEDAVAFMSLVEDMVDIWNVRPDNMMTQCPCGYNRAEDEYVTLDVCRRLKAAGVKVSLATSGAFQDPEVMERALEEGVCELFSISRAFFADPEYYVKLKEGRGEDITPCLTCSKCQGTGETPWLTFCAVNPRYGMFASESAYIHEPRSLKKVAVIGGGPAGMRTAIMAAEKGHSVTLFEKTDYLGGQLKHADHYAFKWPLKRYRKWLIRELGNKKVDVRLLCEPTADELAAAGYDAVFACTGSLPVMPHIEGADDPAVINSHEVWEREDQIGNRVVIVGGSEVGLEAAIHLLQKGREVIVLTRQARMDHYCSKLHSMGMTWMREDENGYGLMSAEWDKYDCFTGITDAKTVKIEPNAVTYMKGDEVFRVECDTVIVGGGTEPNVDSAMRYTSVSSEFYMVGDVEGDCGNLQSVNRRALVKVNLL